MLKLIIISLYFILPAYLANMMPVIAGKIGLPGGKSINERWFGAHKTWRGFYAGFFGALLVLVGITEKTGLMRTVLKRCMRSWKVGVLLLLPELLRPWMLGSLILIGGRFIMTGPVVVVRILGLYLVKTVGFLFSLK